MEFNIGDKITTVALGHIGTITAIENNNYIVKMENCKDRVRYSYAQNEIKPCVGSFILRIDEDALWFTKCRNGYYQIEGFIDTTYCKKRVSGMCSITELTSALCSSKIHMLEKVVNFTINLNHSVYVLSNIGNGFYHVNNITKKFFVGIIGGKHSIDELIDLLSLPEIKLTNY